LNLLSGRPYCVTTLQAASPSFVVGDNAVDPK
jgi:hypothetical protein